MALKRLCRCGTIINYKDKLCNKCSVLATAEKTERNRIYDAEFRNKESAKIYHSQEWQQLTQMMKSKFKGLDIYAYYETGQIVFGNISHHIVEITEDKSKAFDIKNLIYLSGGSHNAIHKAYDKSVKDKKDMQELLFSLVKRWETEFGI